MRTILTPEQLRKFYSVKTRKPMDSKKADDNKLNIQESVDTVLVEVDGQKHQLPSWNAYNKLFHDYKNTKASLQQMSLEVKNLREALRAIGRNVDHVEGELRNKMDKP